jgi:predicted DNA-binding transcriptional regulator YafY
MNPAREETMWRRITPHAFGHDGLRWHVRAYCHIDGIFKDFVLSRCLAVRDLCEPGAAPTQDQLWFSFLNVVLEPNPALNERDRRTIVHEYEMPDGRVTVPVRRALLYYFNKRLRLEAAKNIDDPTLAPLAVVNYDEFLQAIPATKSHRDLLT